MWTQKPKTILLALFCFALLFSAPVICSAEQVYLMTQTQLDNSRNNLILLSQINQQSQTKSKQLEQELMISSQAIAESSNQLKEAKQQLMQASQQTLQQANQIKQLQVQVKTLQQTATSQEELLKNYKQSLTTYLKTHKRPNWELGIGGGFADGMVYSVEVQRNYSSTNAVAIEYLGGSVKGILGKFKIVF